MILTRWWQQSRFSGVWVWVMMQKLLSHGYFTVSVNMIVHNAFVRGNFHTDQSFKLRVAEQGLAIATGIVPDTNQNGVPKDSLIIVTFNESLLPSTVTTMNRVLR